jgi:hypothetical protein
MSACDVSLSKQSTSISNKSTDTEQDETGIEDSTR